MNPAFNATRSNSPALTDTAARVLNSRLPYLALSLLVVAVAGLVTYRESWGQGADIWEHAAVIRELAAHPLAPQHPLLLLNAPHAFFSPYALLLGVLVRLTGWSPILMLQMAGMVEIVLFLVAFRWFVKLLLEHEFAAFLALLFTLFFWGVEPWYWSGFWHLRALASATGYPSVAAAVLTLVIWGLGITAMQRGSWLYLVPASLAAGIVLLSHPNTAIAMLVGTLALAFAYKPVKHLYWRGITVIIIPCALLIAAAWHYYSFFGLLRQDTTQFAIETHTMYVDVVLRIFPALLGLPILVLRARKDWRDPIVWLFLAFSAVYFYGLVSENWGYGRIIAYMVLALHLALAGWLADLLGRWQAQPRKQYLLLGGAALAVLAAVSLSFAGYRRFRNDLRQAPQLSQSYQELAEWVGQYQVVMADPDGGWMVPAFSGKVIASLHPVFFVPDYPQRRQDVRRFFEAGTTLAERQALLKKYGASFLLLTPQDTDKVPLAEFTPLGQVVSQDANLTLIRVAP